MPDYVADRRLLDRIGGPNAVTWPGFWILFIVSALISTASALTSGTGPAWIGVVAATMSVAATYSTLALARVTVLRGAAERPRPWRTLLCFLLATVIGIACSGIVGGILAGATGAAPASSAPPSPSVILLAVVGTLIGADLILVLSAVVVDSWREYRGVAGELRDLEDQLDQLHSTTAAAIEEQDARIRREVEQLMLAEIEALGQGEPAAAAARLRHAALDVVRPMSHGLELGSHEMQAVTGPDTSIDLRQLVRDATAERLFSAWASAIVITVPVLFSALVTDVGAASLLLAALTFVEVCLLAWIANAAYSRLAGSAGLRTRLWCLLGGTAAITTVVWLTWLLVDSAAGFGIAWGVLVWILPVILLLPAALAALRAARSRRGRMLSGMQQDVDWQLARSRELMWVRQTILARALHGPLQSAVLAASLRLDADARTGEVAQSAIDEARSSLFDALAAFGSSPDEAVDLQQAFARLKDMWSGVSEITLEMDESVIAALGSDLVCARAVADVVTEGCSNAVRHGNAKRIVIHLDVVAPSRLRIVMSDNGRALPDGEQGLGSRLLDAVSMTWDRETTSQGTTLSVLLPLRTGALS